MNPTALAPWITAAALAFSSSAALAGMTAMPPANAAPAPTKVYSVDDPKQLIGLDGVSVLGQQYDVRFVGDQSCAQVFSGCDSVDDLMFGTQQEALAASQALLLALDPSDFPRSDLSFHTPYTFAGTVVPGYPVQTIAYEVRVNMGMESAHNVSLYFSPTLNLSGSDRFALWTPAVTAVPEPGTYALMLAGLGAVGFMARRRRSA